jgi:N-carbamoyl-L-amino-acid hydrolase
LAQLTELVNALAMEHAPNAVGTIGHIEVSPNSRNVIAGQVVCTIDMRSHLQEALDAMYEGLLTRAPEICAALGLEFEHKIISQMNPPAFDETCVAAVRDAAENLGYTHRDIVSGAGHDACCINDVAPSAMIFCPCVDGLSHNEAEEITPEWAKAGTDVLLHAVLAKAEVVQEQ